MADPTPEPVQLKLLKGRGGGLDSGGRKVPTAPDFKRVVPEPPFWLEGEALDMWNMIVPELARLSILKEGDVGTLVTYCTTWAVFVDATAAVRRDGLTIEARQGRLANPAVAIQRNAGKELRAIAAHFGLTPSTEQALAKGAGDDGDEENPFD